MTTMENEETTSPSPESSPPADEPSSPSLSPTIEQCGLLESSFSTLPSSQEAGKIWGEAQTVRKYLDIPPPSPEDIQDENSYMSCLSPDSGGGSSMLWHDESSSNFSMISIDGGRKIEAQMPRKARKVSRRQHPRAVRHNSTEVDVFDANGPHYVLLKLRNDGCKSGGTDDGTKAVSHALVPIRKQFLSKAEGKELQILVQPERQHRARYLTEGSRGSVKDVSQQGFPTVKLLGYCQPTALQIFVSTDTGQVRPHGFYQVCPVLGRNTTKCRELKVDGVSVIEMMLEPEQNMTLPVDCIGILKLRNADVEARFGSSRCKKKSTRVRLAFRVMLDRPDGSTLTLQVASTPVLCTQPIGTPEILKKSLHRGSASGGEELFLIGKNFLKDIKIIFQECESGGTVSWEAAAEMELDFFHQNHLIVKVPPYSNQGITSPVRVHISVSTSAGISTEPHFYTYLPNAAALTMEHSTTAGLLDGTNVPLEALWLKHEKIGLNAEPSAQSQQFVDSVMLNTFPQSDSTVNVQASNSGLLEPGAHGQALMHMYGEKPSLSGFNATELPSEKLAMEPTIIQPLVSLSPLLDHIHYVPQVEEYTGKVEGPPLEILTKQMPEQLSDLVFPSFSSFVNDSTSQGVQASPPPHQGCFAEVANVEKLQAVSSLSSHEMEVFENYSMMVESQIMKHKQEIKKETEQVMETTQEPKDIPTPMMGNCGIVTETQALETSMQFSTKDILKVELNSASFPQVDGTTGPELHTKVTTNNQMKMGFLQPTTCMDTASDPPVELQMTYPDQHGQDQGAFDVCPLPMQLDRPFDTGSGLIGVSDLETALQLESGRNVFQQHKGKLPSIVPFTINANSEQLDEQGPPSPLMSLNTVEQSLQDPCTIVCPTHSDAFLMDAPPNLQKLEEMLFNLQADEGNTNSGWMTQLVILPRSAK
uniref:Nuclear factor of activated T-cells 5 n=2 Tax=Eptatretus burgeri TaxID=7764 RepID=A0A8C4Q4A9_EPTBU